MRHIASLFFLLTVGLVFRLSLSECLPKAEKDRITVQAVEVFDASDVPFYVLGPLDDLSSSLNSAVDRVGLTRDLVVAGEVPERADKGFLVRSFAKRQLHGSNQFLGVFGILGLPPDAKAFSPALITLNARKEAWLKSGTGVVVLSLGPTLGTRSNPQPIITRLSFSANQLEVELATGELPVQGPSDLPYWPMAAIRLSELPPGKYHARIRWVVWSVNGVKLAAPPLVQTCTFRVLPK